jgi:hypothetical protein
MRLTVYDKDLFSAGELLKLNFKETFGAKQLIGKTLVPLKSITGQYCIECI